MVKIRNSINTPLQIDSVAVPNSEGVIGMMMCPGKKDYNSFHRPWHRDLDTDLSVVQKWGASAVVSLIEDFEFDYLEVPELGIQVGEMGINLVSSPDRGFEFSGVNICQTLAKSRAGTS